MEIDYDFNGSLTLSSVVEDFFYSSKTGMYVSRHPLVVDRRVLKAADELNIKVQASPEKWLVNTRLSDCLRILVHLGSEALSMPGYFKVRNEAAALKNSETLAALESEQFIEMLATIFIHDECMIHHPVPGKDNTFTGTHISVTTPAGRYGWIHPGDIDPETGLPNKVLFVRKIDDDTLKYWDSHTDIGKEGILMAVRGYVTSVGKISLDLGFPVDAISHKLTIREARRSRPEGTLDEKTLGQAKAVFSQYYTDIENKSIFGSIPAWYDDLLFFIKEKKAGIDKAVDISAQVLKEDIADCIGILLSVALKKGDAKTAGELSAAARDFFNVDAESISDESFSAFMKSRRKALQNAHRERKGIVFVMGHNNPDTDTVISACAEAYRQEVLCRRQEILCRRQEKLCRDDSVFIPVVPGKILPAEIACLLGREFTETLVFTSDEDYRIASTTGRPEWIMVDHNIGPEQPDTRAIIDHHYPSAVSLCQQIPRRIVFAGSTVALVALRIYGLGVGIPPRLAAILHGATLMDTENRFSGKMTQLDELVMDRLMQASVMQASTMQASTMQASVMQASAVNASGIVDEHALYRKLMKELISCYDPDELFLRDYKEDWSFFGFAVAKGIRLLDRSNAAVIERLIALAHNNNKSKNLPLTLVKVVDYADDAETIRMERAFPVFREDAGLEFRQAVADTIITVIRHESGKQVTIEETENEATGKSITYYGVGTQLSRKKLAPVLDIVVNAFNRYFFSPSTGLYFRRDFLKRDEKTDAVAKKHGITLHTGDDSVIVGNPSELKFLVQELGYLCASPAEYFRAYADAGKVNDARMMRQLTSSAYLETLDGIIEKKETLVEHPHINRNSQGYSYKDGIRKKVNILEGKPGLIDINKIDRSTGLPSEVEDPRQYGTGLWRYWSPDSDCAWSLRSTIFAYDMPALDLKFDFSESLPRLAIRPCTASVIHPQVRVCEEEGKIRVIITD